MANITMSKKSNINWVKAIIITAVLIAVVILGYKLIHNSTNGKIDLSEVSEEAVSGADLRIAVLRMDVIQEKSDVLKNLREQRESMEKKLKSEFEKTQKELESEKKAIEKEQSVLSREALSKKVNEYQNKVADFQNEVATKAQKLEMSYQQVLADIQKKHLDPVIKAISEKKKLDIILDGRFSKVSSGAPMGLDITPDVVDVLNKKVSKVNLD